jgi:hypothetical protein
MKKKLVLGSLLGAAAIHVVFLACGTVAPNPDATAGQDATTGDAPSGLDALVDAVRDVIGKLTDAESHDAHAGTDGGADGGTCSCTPPAAESTFALTFDRGRGSETPRADYSTVEVSGRPDLLEGAPVIRVSGIAEFFLADGATGYLECTGVARRDGTTLSTRCLLRLREPRPDGGGLAQREFSQVDASSSVPVLTDSRIEWRVPALMLSPFPAGGPPQVTVSGVVFRTHDPSARFVTPPRAFQP